MIQIGGNTEAVIGQLQRLRAEVPKAVARALSWEKWIERAAEVAEVTLNALAGPDEAQHVRRFSEAIQGATIGGGFALRLTNPLPATRQLLEDALAARGTSASSADVMMGLFAKSIVDLDEALLEWVQTEKDKDERDVGKSDQDIADLMRYILVTPNLGETGQAAREGLVRHIVPWLQRREEEESGLRPETVDLWLRAVLAAWREMIRSEVTRRIRAELRSKKFP